MAMTVKAARKKKNRKIKRIYLFFFILSPHPHYGYPICRFGHPGLIQYSKKKQARDRA
jgi:hypothetical protein